MKHSPRGKSILKGIAILSTLAIFIPCTINLSKYQTTLRSQEFNSNKVIQDTSNYKSVSIKEDDNDGKTKTKTKTKTGEEIKHDVPTPDAPCPSDFMQLEDVVLPESITHTNTTIPRVIHLIVRDRCVPFDIANNLNEWKKLNGYSIVFHDQQNIDEYLSTDRKDLPFIPNAATCAIESIVKSDLAKLLLLWDFGGFVADIDTVPGPSFINGTSDVIEKDDECVLNHMDPPPHPRFLGCRRRHFLVHSLIYKSIGRHIQQFGNSSMNSNRESSLNDVLQHGFKYSVGKNGVGERKKVFTLPERDNIPLQSVTLIKTADLKHPFLTDLATANSTWLDLQIRPSPVEECVNFSERNLSDQDIESLLQLVGGHDIAGNAEDPCHDNGNLTLLHDTYKPQSIREERKIPKIVHMTSKTRCMTDRFEENINLWRFDDHSLFIHDDDAVSRLLDKVFVEFPLLQDVRHCIHSGAGLADLWRYVVLWVYGGLYTDIDNAPGKLFNDGAIINASTDAMFEQEGGKFPSQYFIATSPQHPVSYFMVQQSLNRLLGTTNIALQNTAVITGPGATKTGVMSFMGDGYPTTGNYTGTHNRTMTIIGHYTTAKKSLYIKRAAVADYEKKKEYAKMNMTHFLIARNKAKQEHAGKHNSCLSEVYKLSRMRDEDASDISV